MMLMKWFDSVGICLVYTLVSLLNINPNHGVLYCDTWHAAHEGISTSTSLAKLSTKSSVNASTCLTAQAQTLQRFLHVCILLLPRI